jgi:hypothetical protein
MTTSSSLPFKGVDASTGTQSLLAASDHSTMSPPTKPLDRERERERERENRSVRMIMRFA